MPFRAASPLMLRATVAAAAVRPAGAAAVAGDIPASGYAWVREDGEPPANLGRILAVEEDEEEEAVLCALEDASRSLPVGGWRPFQDEARAEEERAAAAARAAAGIPPSATELPESCFDRHWAELQAELAPTGHLPLVAARLYDAGACENHGHRAAIAALDLAGYAEIRPGPSRFQLFLLHKFRDHLDRLVSSELLATVAAGAGVCIPRQCLGDAQDVLRAAVEYVAYATGFGRQTAWLPAPVPHLHLNLTTASAWTASSEEGVSLPPLGTPPVDASRPFETGCIIGRVPEFAQFCWRADVGLAAQLDAEGAPRSVAAGGPRAGLGTAPRWMLCEDAGFDEEWRQWGPALRALRSKAGCGRSCVLSLVRRADEIVRRHAWVAWDWASSVLLHSAALCNSDSPSLLKVWSGDELCAYHFLLDGPPQRWGRQRCRARWAGFCPFGYVAALVVRAEGLVELGHGTFAADDLKMASAMLGWCKELDLLDPGVWGVRSQAIERTLFRLEAPEDFARTAAELTPEPPWRATHTTQAVWHALQLNTLVRMRLSAAAAAVAAGASAPRLAMLTYPSYLAILLIPALLRVWPDMDLALFYLGIWLRHEKCPSCAAYYHEHFVVEDSYLQALPLDFEGQGAGRVVWGESPNHQEFTLALQAAFGRHPRAKAADVLLCTAPLWLCATLLLASIRPLLSLCLVRHDIGMPPGPTVEWARRHVLEQVVEPLAESVNSVSGSVPRALWVREDVARSYTNLELEEYGFFHPFVHLPSLYIQARYECRDVSDVVVMREGSLGRFSIMMRGRVFFAALAQMTPACSWRPSCPWKFRILPYLRERLPYGHIARHRAAVFIPSVWYGKITFKDLITMEIPLFMPDLDLQASISQSHEIWGCGPWMTAPKWVLSFCTALRIQHRLPQSSFFRYAHIQHFSSLTDLVHRLASLDCAGLREINARMRDLNAAILRDDLGFWRTAITALATAANLGVGDAEVRQDARGPPASAGGGGVEERRAPAFELPAASPDADCAAFAAYCGFRSQPEERQRCCQEVAMVRSGSQATRHAGAPSGSSGGLVSVDGFVMPTAAANCLRSINDCSDGMLMYGTHFLQQLPGVV